MSRFRRTERARVQLLPLCLHCHKHCQMPTHMWRFLAVTPSLGPFVFFFISGTFGSTCRVTMAAFRLLSVSSALATAVSLSANHSVIRNTTLGRVQGTSDGKVATFNSIPFAAPPLGDFRFRRVA